MNSKALIINDLTLCHYEWEGTILFLKMRVKNINDLTESESEDFCTKVISVIENIKVTHIAYLNIQ